MSKECVEYALHTWAAGERGELNMGYPKASIPEWVAPWPETQATRIPDTRDLEILDVVSRGISKIRQKQDHKWRDTYYALEVFYWVDSTETPDRRVRIDKHLERYNWSKSKFNKAMDRGRDYLMALVDVYLDKAA